MAALLATGHYSSRLYAAYSVFYVVGTVLIVQIPVVGLSTLTRTESMTSHVVLLCLQVRGGKMHCCADVLLSCSNLRSVLFSCRSLQHMFPLREGIKCFEMVLY